MSDELSQKVFALQFDGTRIAELAMRLQADAFSFERKDEGGMDRIVAAGASASALSRAHRTSSSARFDAFLPSRRGGLRMLGEQAALAAARSISR